MSGPTAVVATRLEERAARRELSGVAPVARCGVGAPRLPGGELLLSCGVAGGLDPLLPSGTVVVPDWVGRSPGERLFCDPALSARLRAAAGRLGLACARGGLLTAERLVVGAERLEWHARGYAAADQETAALFAAGVPVAAVRVILDTPGRELSARWARPAGAVLRPTLWRELAWLARAAPSCARLAAAVAAEALGPRGLSPPALPTGSGTPGSPS